METNGEDAVLRPIVWIVLMFLSSFMSGLVWQWYIFVVVRTKIVRPYCDLIDHLSDLHVSASTSDIDPRRVRTLVAHPP